MHEPPDDLDISFVEDLDPEPPSRSGVSRMRESVLGVVLLLGVLGWSGWQWWAQQVAQNHYRLGQEAAARYDWDQARAHFAAAPGYRDADARAAEAARQIAERGRQYDKASHALKSGNWPTALQAAQAVEKIQPEYEQVGSIAYEAEKRVYGLALSGTIALRTEISRPGLYYHDGNDWRWLQGSDRWSSVRGWGPRGHVVYDVPSKEWTPDTTPIPTPDPRIRNSPLGSPWLKGRDLAVATITGHGYSFSPLALDPTQYDFYRWGQNGVWAFRYRRDLIDNYDPSLRYNLLRSYDIAYQAFSGNVSSPLALPGEKWALLDLSPSGDKVAFVAREEAPGGGERDLLHVAGGDGRNPKLLYAHTGTLSQVRFDPTGRYLLFTAHTPPQGDVSWRHSLILLDTLGEKRPQVLAATSVVQQEYGVGFPTLSAAFLSGGPFRGKLLVSEWAFSRLTLSILDPADPTADRYKTTIAANPTTSAIVIERQDGTAPVVVWQEEGESTGAGGAYPPGASPPPERRLVAAALVPGPGWRPFPMWRTSRLPMEPDRVLSGARLRPESGLTGAYLRGDLLVYTTSDTQYQFGNTRHHTVRSIPLSELGPADPPVTTVHNLVTAEGRGNRMSDMSVGPHMLAYIASGQLHAHTYDGTIDLPLERGIRGLYNFPLEHACLCP